MSRMRDTGDDWVQAIVNVLTPHRQSKVRGCLRKVENGSQSWADRLNGRVCTDYLSGFAHESDSKGTLRPLNGLDDKPSKAMVQIQPE